MEILFNICEITLFIYLAYCVVKLFVNILSSIKKKDKKSIAINSIIFILGLLFYLIVINPIGRVCIIYQEIVKAF